MKFTEQEIKDYEAQNNTVITRCPVCEPLSYYGGKTGYKEVEDKNMCDCCWKALADLFAYMAAQTGDGGFLTDRTSIFGGQYAKAMHAYIAGSGIPFIFYKAPIDYKIERLCSIPLSENYMHILQNQNKEEIVSEKIVSEEIMSRGGWFHFYYTCTEVSGALESEQSPLRRALGAHMRLIANAIYAMELDDSSDKQKSSEEDPIRAVFGNARNTREL